MPFIFYYSSSSNFLSRFALYSIKFCFPPRDQTCLIMRSSFVDRHLCYIFGYAFQLSDVFLSSRTLTSSIVIELSSDLAPRNSTRKIINTRSAKAYTNMIKCDLTQSANQQTPLVIDAFWDKPIPDPPLRREKWRVQYKFALTKENIILDTLLGPKPEMVDLPLAPIYEERFVGSSAHSERERNARNAQQKINLQNKFQRLIEIGIMCGYEHWPLVDWKMVSLLYLSIEVEGRRILNCKIHI